MYAHWEFGRGIGRLLRKGWDTGANGAGYRGGNWNNSTDYLRSSDRNNAANTNTERNNNNGSRAVRPAP